MSVIFRKIDEIRPTYDMTYRAVLPLCKLLPVVDILITTVAAAGRYTPFTPDPAWNKEMALACMSYMVVLSAALAIRKGARVRVTAFNRYLPPKLVRSLDIVADLAVLALAVIMIAVSWKYATGIGAKGTCMSTPKVSRFWIYFPVPLTGVAMLVLEVGALYNHVEGFLVKKGME